MKRVLVIADNRQQQERLQEFLQVDRSIHVTTMMLHQVNSKRLRSLRRTDLIILEAPQEGPPPSLAADWLSVLQMTDIPILVLPPPTLTETASPPVVYNLTERTLAKPGLVDLINRLRSRHADTVSSLPSPADSASPATANLTTAAAPAPAPNPVPAPTKPLHQQLADYGKVMHTLASVRRISHQLREPLSNMNLAIHMLSQARSSGDRDRYLKLLREEYQRELQLLNQLDDLQANLPPMP